MYAIMYERFPVGSVLVFGLQLGNLFEDLVKVMIRFPFTQCHTACTMWACAYSLVTFLPVT